VKIFSQLQRLGLDFYEREMSGRIMTRMTTDVDALSTFLQTGLITMVNSVLTFVGVLAALLSSTCGWAWPADDHPGAGGGHAGVPGEVAKAYTEAREKVSIVNADLAGERGRAARTAQAYRREGRNQDRFAELRAPTGSRLRAQRYIALYFPFVQLLSTVGGALVLFVAAGEVHNGR
jgi:ATP-binding cassette subfamily B protein